MVMAMNQGQGYSVNSLDRALIDRFPTSLSNLERCEPVYEEFTGWDQPTESARDLKDLPAGAMQYVNRLQELIGVPIDVISTGPKREETITIRPIIGS